MVRHLLPPRLRDSLFGSSMNMYLSSTSVIGKGQSLAVVPKVATLLLHNGSTFSEMKRGQFSGQEGRGRIVANEKEPSSSWERRRPAREGW